ncbi:hypothetical protein PQR36_19115 [Paraburkholderia nemoris]|uniref:hypothetical protein n=1 Tax=Paraburkholderia nemoris TaxID=2793076 RepID=UPI0038BDFE36
MAGWLSPAARPAAATINKIAMDSMLWEGQLLAGTIVGHKPHLFRVCYVRKEDDKVFLREIASGRPESTSRAREYEIRAIERRIHKKHLREMAECVRTAAMSGPCEEAQREAAIVRVLERRAELLGCLITPDGRARYYGGRQKRREILTFQSNCAGVSKPRLLFLIGWYENFGCCRDALRPFPIAETRSRKKTQHKRGAKNIFARSNPRSTKKGFAVNRWARQKIEKAVLEFVIRRGMTYEQARREMHRLFWFQDTVSPDGVRRRYRVAKSKWVTPSQFAYYARAIKRHPGRLRSLVGQREWRDRLAAGRGASADLSIAPGDIYDLDGTVAKFEIKSASGRPIGRPTLMVAADRGSTAIVGVHVTSFEESTATFKAVLFEACVGRSRLLRRLGIPENSSSCHAVPNQIFVDRGAGNSDEMRESISNELANDLNIAPIGNGRAKGLAEGLISLISRRLKSTRGGYTRDRNYRDMDRRKHARRMTRLTRAGLSKIAWEEAEKYNQDLALRYHTAEMRRAGIAPTREAIFRFGIEHRRGGEVRTLSDMEVYTKLLVPLKKHRMRKEGIYHRGAFFTSQEYATEYEIQIARALGQKRNLPWLSAFRDPNDPTRLYWRRSDGSLARLLCTITDARRWEEMLTEDVDTEVAAEDIRATIRHARKKTFKEQFSENEVDKLAASRRIATSCTGDGDTLSEATDAERNAERGERLRDSRNIMATERSADRYGVGESGVTGGQSSPDANAEAIQEPTDQGSVADDQPRVAEKVRQSALDGVLNSFFPKK